MGIHIGRLMLLCKRKNDELKRAYAKKHGIPLYEIPYKNKKYEMVDAFLRGNRIIASNTKV